MAENFLYFTELLSMPVVDLKGRRIGRVKDAAMVPLVHASRIDRLLVGGTDAWLAIRFDQVHTISPSKGIELTMRSSSRTTTTSTSCASPATCWISRSSMSPAAK
jgi:sporulation protein YlmC with PRC-barrel domain